MMSLSNTSDASSVPLGDSIQLGSNAWADLFADRCRFERAFADLLGQAPQLKGRVLDIGCGGDLPDALKSLRGRFGSLDGLDPDPAVAGHPLLTQRWQSALESSAVPAASYDLAYAYNVLEHVAAPGPFLAKVSQVLKPGGVFYALTPNAAHPFAALSRLIEGIGLKGYARTRLGVAETGRMRVNDYPAYYRCNSPRAIRRAIRGAGFRRATFYFHPCVQWDNYFPARLRWLPRAYDFLAGSRFTPLMLVFMVRLEK